MARHFAALALAIFACSDEPLSLDAAVGPFCCSDGTQKAVRDQCLASEIGLPLSSCGIDAGTPDAGAADAGAASCGDGVIDPNSEVCERSAQCNDAQLVCRRCQCRDKAAPVELTDAEGDVDASDPRQIDFVRVSMTIPAPPAADLEMRMADNAMPQAEEQRICLVILDSGTMVQTLCWILTPEAMFDATLRDANGERTVTPAVVVGRLTPSLRVPATVGLRLEPGLDFYWVSYYGATEADRLPEQGSYSFREIFGS
jgi:hypothetical protein